MLGWSDVELASIIFHELTHQMIYVPNDADFNEALAVTVEEEGVRRWLESLGRDRDLERYRAYQERFAQVLGAPDPRRGTSCARCMRPGSIASRCAERRRPSLPHCDGAYHGLDRQWGGHAPFDAWFEGDLNNAQSRLDRHVLRLRAGIPARARGGRRGPRRVLRPGAAAGEDGSKAARRRWCAEHADERGFHPPRNAGLSPRQPRAVRGRHRDLRAPVLRPAADAGVQPPIRRERGGKCAFALVAHRGDGRRAIVRRRRFGCAGTQADHGRIDALLGAPHPAHCNRAQLARVAGASHLARPHIERAAGGCDDLSQRGGPCGIHRSRYGPLHRRERRRWSRRAAADRDHVGFLRLALGDGLDGRGRIGLRRGVLAAASRPPGASCRDRSSSTCS